MQDIRYGSEIVLQHEISKLFLRSPGVPYTNPGASGQDQVTCAAKIDSRSIWIVKPPHKYPDDYLFGQPVPKDAVFRLENRATRKNLHSHPGITSPLSRQGEVTCYGEPGEGDFNDNWRLEIDGEQINLESESKFRLIHTITNYALHSHVDRHYENGDQEVTGFPNRDANDFWTVVRVHGPIIPPTISSGGKAATWLSILNIMASAASITGVTFLVLGASLQTSSFAQLLSATIAVLIIFGIVCALFLLLLEIHRNLRLKMRPGAWLLVVWTTGSGIGVLVVLYFLRFLILFRSSQIEPLLRDVFHVH